MGIATDSIILGTGLVTMTGNNCYFNQSLLLSQFNTPTINTGISYFTVSGSGQMIPNAKYKSNTSNARTILNLPSGASLGDQVLCRGFSISGWQITQNSGQVIHGASSTTTGISGSLSSQSQYDTVGLECIAPTTDWIIIGSRGTLTII